MRIITEVSKFSKIRGGAKKYVGPNSCKSISTVSEYYGQAVQSPDVSAWAYEKIFSPTHAIGR